MHPRLRYSVALASVLLVCLRDAVAAPPKATTQILTLSTRYTTCGIYHYNVSTPVKFGKSDRWFPVAAFFYITDGLLDGVVSGINGFFERYAACGMSRQLDLVLPREEASLSMECGHFPCSGSRINLAVSDLTVKRGEFTRILERIFDKVGNIDDSVPYEERQVYFFLNINCSQHNSKLYPDWCNNNLPHNILNLIGAHLTVNFVWYTPINDLFDCYKGTAYVFDNVTIMAYNTSQRFNDVLTPKCIASIGTKLATTTTTGTKPSVAEEVIIGASVAVGIGVAVAVGCLVFFWFRRRNRLSKSLDVSLGPHEFHASDVCVLREHILGAGAFATVYKAICSKQDVALKVPRVGHQANIMSITREINHMHRIAENEHIVRILGFLRVYGVPAIVMELCEVGDLWHYLRRALSQYKESVTSVHKPVQNIPYVNTNVSLNALFRICWEISDGMEFLSSAGCIHRDLAARNVLLTSELVAKISDFGLCRYTDGELYSAYQEANLPTKWMALEALKDATFSTQSDVWSYGVLIYEIFSGGDVPYADICAPDLLKHLESGGRLPQPPLCTADTYDMMKDCWLTEPIRRPTFTELKCFFSRCLKRIADGYAYSL